MSEMPSDPTYVYIARNAAHCTFRASLANAKALAFVVADNDAAVLRAMLAKAEEAKRNSPTGTYAIGKCGSRSTRTSVHAAIVLRGAEIDLIENELGGFRSQIMGLIYRELHRVFETYLVDLFDEIATLDKRVLFTGSHSITYEEALRLGNSIELHRYIIEDKKAQLTRGGYEAIEKTFGDLGLPIISATHVTPNSQEIRHRLRMLNAVRNVIEHNRSRVNRDFLKIVPDSKYKVGEVLQISLDEFGDALLAVEMTADDVNRRAIEKFGIEG